MLITYDTEVGIILSAKIEKGLYDTSLNVTYEVSVEKYAGTDWSLEIDLAYGVNRLASKLFKTLPARVGDQLCEALSEKVSTDLVAVVAGTQGALEQMALNGDEYVAGESFQINIEEPKSFIMTSSMVLQDNQPTHRV